MRRPLRIIHLEDDPHDQELVRRLLALDGLDCEITHVETRSAYEAALEKVDADLIMSDFTLPAFDGMSALRMARTKCPDIPYLFVSGTLGEEQAIESLKNGATDYVLKSHLERLVPAVRRALTEAEERAHRKRSELLRETFFQLAQRLSSATTPEAAARIIVAVAEELLGWDACTLDLYSAEEDSVRPILMMETVLGKKLDQPFAFRTHRLTSRMRRCIEQGGQLLPLENAAESSVLSDRHSALFPSVLMVPVRHGQKVIGVLSIEKYNRPPYGVDDLETLLALADHCGGALERIAIEEETVRLMTALRQQQKRLDALLGSVPAIVWESWAKSNPAAQQINFVSPYIETLLGYTVQEWLAVPNFWLEVLHPQDKQRFTEEIGRMIASGRTTSQQCRWVAKDGRIVWVETGATAICDANGKPLGLRGVAIDITEKKSLETQFFRSHRMESIGTLASGVAHDLNNILSPILLSVQLLRQRNLDEESCGLLSLVETYADRGAQIVKRVLTFARGSEGEQALLDPKRVLQEMVTIAGETFPKSIVIRANISPKLWPIHGDPTLLHQALLNLCVNARDAMPNGGTLTLSAENLRLDQAAAALTRDANVGPCVLIEVRDTGQGIPAEFMDKIFDPFFTTKPPSEGTGLGLSTVIGIVKSHRGFISVESKVGQGSRFKVFLPALPDAQVESEQPKPATLPDGTGGLILVVDDEEGIRTLARRVLKARGYDVLVASNGVEALALFKERQNEIQLVLTDIRMPEMDGVSLAKELRRITPDLRIVTSSGFGEEKRLAELAELGIRSFLDKPYSAETLLSAIHRELHQNSPQNL